MKLGKVFGGDQVTCLRQLMWWKSVCSFFKAWNKDKVPKGWIFAVNIPLDKDKGIIDGCKNQRGLVLSVLNLGRNLCDGSVIEIIKREDVI